MVDQVDACLVFVLKAPYFIFPVFFIALVASNGRETIQGRRVITGPLPGAQRLEG